MVNLFSLPGAIYLGSGAIKNISRELIDYGIKKVFLVSDSGVAEAGIVDMVIEEIRNANVDVSLFSEVEQEPSVHNLDSCFKQFTVSNCDLIVGLGGGSSMDVAKGVSILATNGGNILDYVGIEMVAKKGIPKFLIPTTIGTGSEVTKNAIFTDEAAKKKITIVSRHLLPEVAVIDPVLTVTLPPSVIAATGMDALTHAIESYTSKKATIHTDLYALKAIELIGANLKSSFDFGNDLNIRENMTFGSTFAGIALANAGAGAVHACAYALGGRFGMRHGVANALLLPHIMECSLFGNLHKYANIARVLGGSTKQKSLQVQAELSCEIVLQLLHELGMEEKLSDFGVTKANVSELAEETMKNKRLMDNNPKVLTLDEIESCFLKALD